MKFIDPPPGSRMMTLEMTRRNLEVLLRKLDDDESYKTIVDPDWRIVVTAVENEAHYGDREPGPMLTPSTGEIL